MRKLAFFLLFCGCSHLPKSRYEVKAFGLNVLALDDLRESLKLRNPDIDYNRVLGYAVPAERELYVPYAGKKDDNGKELPDFCILGHEVWHLQELGWFFHK